MNAVILDRLIRIGIADDNELVRDTLRLMLDCSPSIQVVGEAGNGSEAIAMVEAFQPDVVLMDISMPVVNGIQATRSITSNFPDTKVIVLGMHTDQTSSDTALHAGACQFLTKDCGREKLLNAIKECSAAPLKVVGHSPH
jgi:two-component system, NarL family, response regulator DegU